MFKRSLIAIVCVITVSAIAVWGLFIPTYSADAQAARRLARKSTTPIFDAGISVVAYQQDVDHFSNDARAMSPRSWGNFFDGGAQEPQAPQVTFDAGKPVESVAPGSAAPRMLPPESPMRQVESSRVREPKPFFEQEVLDPTKNQRDSSEFSSPLPLENGDQAKSERANEALESRLENTVESTKPESVGKGENFAPDSSYPDLSGFGDTNYGSHVFGAGANCPKASIPIDVYNPPRYPIECNEISACECDRCRLKQRLRRRRSQPLTTEKFCENDCRDNCCPPEFNESLGHRYDYRFERGSRESSNTKFSFEEDGEFPPASEILAQSIFWSEFDFMFLQPSFQGNTAFTTDGPAGISQPFNFDLEHAFRVAAGFESDYGPGFAVDYFQFDNNSDFANFTSDGIITGTTSVYQLGPNYWTDLIADDPGETINAFHSLEVHSTSVYAFKAIKFKRAYVNGRFGLQIVSVEQIMRASLSNAANVEIGQLNHFSNIEAFGPRFGIDYVRKIGHTPAQLIASATTSLLFGDRDQFVENTSTGDLTRIGADEFVSVFDIFFGVQGKRIRGEKRNNTFRVGFVNQTWFGGGTGIDPNGDFGFQGLSFMFGLNR